MELEELRQRLLLRSKSSDIPPIAHPVQVPDLPLSQAASKVKWETSLPPEVTARVGNGGAKPETQGAKTGKEAGRRASEHASVGTRPPKQHPSPRRRSRSRCSPPPSGSWARADQGRSMTLRQARRAAQADRNRHPVGRAGTGAHPPCCDFISPGWPKFSIGAGLRGTGQDVVASSEPMAEGLDTQLNLVVQALYSNVKEAKRGVGAGHRLPEQGSPARERAGLDRRTEGADFKPRRGFPPGCGRSAVGGWKRHGKSLRNRTGSIAIPPRDTSASAAHRYKPRSHVSEGSVMSWIARAGDQRSNR